MSAIQLFDKNSELRFDGTSVGGGSTPPARNVGQTELDFNGLAVNNATVAIPFVFGGGDATMLNLAAPTVPFPVAAGIYSYTLTVLRVAGGDGGAFQVALIVDDDYYSLTVRAGKEPLAASLGVSGDGVTLSVTWFGTAGSAFHASITETGSDTYQGNLYVQKIA